MMTFLNSESASGISYEDVANQLKTNLKFGLNNGEVVPRRKLYSYNEFDVKTDDPLWLKYLEKFKEPMILLLLASAFISILMKQFDDAISITCVSSTTRPTVLASSAGFSILSRLFSRPF